MPLPATVPPAGELLGTGTGKVGTGTHSAVAGTCQLSEEQLSGHFMDAVTRCAAAKRADHRGRTSYVLCVSVHSIPYTITCFKPPPPSAGAARFSARSCDAVPACVADVVLSPLPPPSRRVGKAVPGVAKYMRGRYSACAELPLGAFVEFFYRKIWGSAEFRLWENKNMLQDEVCFVCDEPGQLYW